MIDPLTPLVDTVVQYWYVIVILGLSAALFYFFLKSSKKAQVWSVVFKRVFKKGVIEEEQLNKSNLKFIKRGNKTIGKILRYSEVKVPVKVKKSKERETNLVFSTVVFYSKNILGFWYSKNVMRFLRQGEYPNIDRKNIVFDITQTFKEKDGFYIPLGSEEGTEMLFNTIAEDIQKFDKDRTQDINASSMMKLAGLPPEWAHQEKMRELDLEFMQKYKKAIGWKAG